jgi:hypothetical protein
MSTETRKGAFERIYETNYWGGAASGAGSTLEATIPTLNVLRKILQEHKISSIVDVACGDFGWMPKLLAEYPDVEYIGCDIVESLITAHAKKFPQYKFQHLDFVNQQIPAGELIICREAHQHLPVQDIQASLENFEKSGAKLLLATVHLRRHGIKNRLNIKAGRCRDRNLLVEPFNLPNPLVIYPDTLIGSHDKFLGLWELPFRG